MSKNTLKDRAAAAGALMRIADFLDVPIAAFYDAAPGSDGTAPVDPVQQAEIRELVRQFQRLRDPKARGRCLAYVRRIADEANRSPLPPTGLPSDPAPGLDGS